VAAASGGAYAAMTASSTSIVACVHHNGGGLYKARKCARHDGRLVWSVTGPRGATGPQGPQGNQGPQGIQGRPGTPDTSQFYTQAESDTRFLRGSGGVTTIPLVDLPNGGSGPLVDIAGVGKLEVVLCALGNSEFSYTNESNGAQNYVLLSAYHGRNNVDPDTGSVAAGSSFTGVNNDSHDLIRLSLSNGTKVVDFAIAQSRTGSSDCLYWGEVYSG
jgi:hypothetical protein